MRNPFGTLVVGLGWLLLLNDAVHSRGRSLVLGADASTTWGGIVANALLGSFGPFLKPKRRAPQGNIRPRRDVGDKHSIMGDECEVGVLYTKGTYYDTDASNYGDCRGECFKWVPMCKVFSFSATASRCRVHAGDGQKINNSLWVSGQADPGWKEAAIPEDGVLYTDGTFRQMEAVNFDNCRSRCSDFQHCRSYSFCETNVTCRLHEGNTEKVKDPAWQSGRIDYDPGLWAETCRPISSPVP